MKEEYLKECLSNSPVAYQSLDAEGNILDVNINWLKELGYELEDVQGKWFGDFLGDSSRELFIKNFPRFKEQGHIKNVRFGMNAKDGRIVEVEFEGKIIYSKEGGFSRTHCIFQRLGSSQENIGDIFHQSVFEQTVIPMVVIDPETFEIEDLNIAACRLYGADYKTVISKNVLELSAESKEKLENMKKLVLRGELMPFETRITDFSGNRKTLEVLPAVFDVKDKKYITLVLADRTEQELSAKKLQLKSDIANAFLSHDESEIFSAISRILRDTFHSEFCFVGYIDKSGSLVNPSMTTEIWDKCRLDDKTFIFPHEAWGGMWGDSLKEKRSFYRNEGLEAPAGHVELTSALAVVVCDDDNLLGQFVLANKPEGYNRNDLDMGLLIADTMRPVLKFWLEDKFSRELLNEKKEELRQQLVKEIELTKKQEQILFEQKKFADMGQMLSAIAHQWRQPLNNIHLIMHSIENLFRGKNSTLNFDQLMELHKETVEFMSGTIDSFRDYLAQNSKHVEFSVSEAIFETVNLVCAQFMSQNIHISFETGGETITVDCENIIKNSVVSDDIILGDKSNFHQIMLNLLSNARDALLDYRNDHQGQGQLKIAVNSVGDMLIIVIRNTGYPIDKDVMPNIFDPYFTTKAEGKGTGIGLYMTKMFIEDGFKGSILAENRSDGVEFIITIPRV